LKVVAVLAGVGKNVTSYFARFQLQRLRLTFGFLKPEQAVMPLCIFTLRSLIIMSNTARVTDFFCLPLI